ncbi:hypothetical protein AAFC00_000759 [Neodothiora populina]
MLSSVGIRNLALCTQIFLQDSSASPFTARFNKTANSLLEDLHIPGFSIAVVHGSETYAAGYGLATIPDVPATADTLYYPGSTTKAFTAAAVSLLVDNSSFNWDTPLSTIIHDDFVLSDDWATKHITVEDALSHRTGLPRHDFVYGGKEGTAQSIVRRLRDLPLTAEPRTRFQYCNLMFTTMGYVVEKVSSSSLGAFMREKIWQPLNMTNTYSSVDDALNSPRHFATGYAWKNDTSQFIDVPYTPVGEIGGAGFIISTVSDYAKWLRVMIYQSPPLSKSGHAAVISARTLVPMDLESMLRQGYIGDVTYGLGWERFVYRGYLVISHSGGIRGFGTLLLYVPQLEWGAVMMGNNVLQVSVAEQVVILGLLDDLLSVAEEDRFDYVELYRNQTAEKAKLLESAEETLYPDLPSSRLPKLLPLTKYAGSYHHPAYGNVRLSAKGSGLHVTFNKTLVAGSDSYLDHISGEYWIVTVVDSDTKEIEKKTKAEFRVGSNGHVMELGAQIDDELAALNRKTWFKKVE